MQALEGDEESRPKDDLQIPDLWMGGVVGRKSWRKTSFGEERP